MKNNHFHNHDGVYELSPITNQLLLVKPVTKCSLHVCLGGRFFFSDLFTALPSTAFAKFGHELFSKIILGVFVVWKKLVSVKRRAVDQSVHLSTIEQAEPTEFTSSSERRQHFISVPLTTDKRQHYTIHLSG